MQRRVSLRRKSKKRAALDRSVEKAKAYLREESGRCEWCGHSPDNPWTDKPMQCSVLTINEVRRGSGNRPKTQGHRHSTLVLCWYDNSVVFTDPREWPEARQLCLLQHVRPQDYDLDAHNFLVNPRAPNRITQAEVDVYADEIRQLTNGRA
jgi:hypothetical protein